ncbi:tyrosine phosphatase IA-2 isoform X2 [Arctopsyche grandis]|uniref:tyrosine phosphatase IA-2 isoform X2 n=1 Tax=Arctopsyche grandis TaxID=121162 RepID=UPI00406D7810
MRRLLLLLLLGCCSFLPAEADGNVGCLFSETLCTEKVEWCYDDYAFGKCLQMYGNVEEEDLIRHELTTEELRGFERELQRLLQLGYRWSHAYTQCILQAMLYATRNKLHYDQKVCDHLIDQDLTAALGAFESDDQVDPQTVAFVKFTPNSDIEPSNFADEVYFPPNEKDYIENLQLMPNNDMQIEEQPELHSDYDDWPQPVKRSYRRMNRRSSPTPREQFQVFSRIYNTPGDFREGRETRDLNLPPMFDSNEDNLPVQYPAFNEKTLGYLYNLPLTFEEILYLMKPENEDELRALLPRYEEEAEGAEMPIPDFHQMGKKDALNTWLENQDLDQLKAALADLNEPYKQPYSDPYYVSTTEYLTQNRQKPDRFNQHYNTPERFRQGYESRDGIVNSKDEEIQEPRIYFDEDDVEHFKEDAGSGEHDGRLGNARDFEYLTTNEILNNDYQAQGNKPHYQGSQGNQNALLSRIFNTWKTRESKERDSQRSGAFTEGGVVYVDDTSPTGEPNEGTPRLLTPELGALLADYEWGFRRHERLDVKKPGPPFDVKNQHFKHDTDNNHTENAEGEPIVASLVKKEVHGEPGELHSERGHDSYDVDSSYAYVGFKDRVDRNEVTFKVEENSKALNASEVAKRIDDIKDELRRELNVEVTSAGVGDKAKLPAVLKLNSSTPWGFLDWGDKGTLQLALLLAGVAAMVSSATVLIAAHFYYRRRSKLAHLATGDTEPSQDYQDLCRSRMSGKWQIQSATPEKPVTEKQEVTGQRITSLSRESDNNSPSTRSSTSSWSEEPALTNMDISTGHMVLTYMEDHLKNKDRLEQEWQALCAYEAEPCATTAAETDENVKKNRKPGVLPYDHSRLVLNDVTNLNSSDYINASTITDHDPRNPAYIAAQGPLPHTAPDFWQMVWEQGSVVMVMLTRLTEGGVAMCHRYWPEEGSDLYHIYEVHLVSEHIWCDDYLVRSFYLKNLKTGETRTVTQFHFLSWPDRGIPSSTKALLEFRRKVNKSYRGRSCPIVVHCSDGASRTGTYCLIDMVLNRMAKGAKEIDIAATLEHIRDQRPDMVTTKQQFEFVLMAVAEEVHAILKALPAQLQQQHEKREKELADKDKQEKQEKQEK